MAFKYQLILWAALVIVLAAASASVQQACIPGQQITYDSLHACSDYVVRQTCGFEPYYVSVETMKKRCCEQLSGVSSYCRCEVVRILMEGIVNKRGEVVGSLLQDWPRCKSLTREYIAGIVGRGECNLETILGRPECPTAYLGAVV
ncbi:hypothetical protein CFC21_060648 [Triticum aestivum]|uniref:Bifunctional inhibitor/plant lipid transfer protein/seed storage helical domain-containing protein n=3 Tax=Triticinae TaxID=1648030 RepID=A0A9R1GT45_WHEAT|nr:trypsin/alpha-amylase inhibitor CMX1/CMX3-like [Aegilops tauschii subsp. strangulata]XP_044374326.1 trypsin/alpha-amylase inhibitor CMX1/CMX3-like [Triticum aestivum]KAF7052564.1 hypothetical protein CFC21_060648 [Triticum aestivum]